jgi:hypothetical protein
LEDAELKALVEQLKKERDEQNAKINGLTIALEEEKVNKKKEILIAKINGLGEKVEGDHSVDYFEGYHAATIKLTEKINSITEELSKINGCGSSGKKVPPTGGNQSEYVNTPLGRKLRSEVDQGMMAKVNSTEQKKEVK